MIYVVQEIPKLLKYWDFEYNDYLNIETAKVNSRIQAHWRCPSCLYGWEDSIVKTYNRSAKNDNFCPCCSLGELLVKEKNSIFAVYPSIIQYLNFHYENQETIDELLKSEKFNSKRVFHFKCPTCHIGWRGTAINYRLFQSENQELFHINCNEWASRFYYYEVYPNLKKIYKQESNKIDFNGLKLSDNVTIPYYWECDNCHYEFKISIDTLFSRIKNKGSYCTECKNSFDKLLDINLMEAPLSFLNPKDLIEWADNNIFSTNQVDSLSNIAVNWKCSICHGEYTCSVIDKNKQSCPYCNDKEMLRGFNTLEITHSYLQKFWNPNNHKILSDFWKKSHEVIMWTCPCCQIDFQCSPNEMVSRTDLENQNFQTCPNMCDWGGEVFNNDILRDYPILKAEWSPKNKIPIHFALTHIETKKYWWNCSTCNGEYQCSIPIRKELAISCPYCNHEKPLKGFNTLLDLYPDLANMWSSKNSVTLEKILPNEAEKRQSIWHCNNCQLDFQEHFNIVLYLYLKDGEAIDNICPYCTKRLPNPKTGSLNIIKPYLVDEWISELNGDISKEFPDSKKYIKWKCRRCHGEFWASINSRKENDKLCPYCEGIKLLSGFNSLDAIRPELLGEWSPENTFTMKEVMPSSLRMATWNCKDCHGKYIVSIRERVQEDFQCPYCSGKIILPGFNSFAAKYPEYLLEWDYLNNMLLANPDEISEKSNIKVWWLCKNDLEHRYQMSVSRKIKYDKRKKETCIICKGLRRKREHFVPYEII
ncbi:zinc-ribbon domain-containing protein [Streptococcus pneumoniae]